MPQVMSPYMYPVMSYLMFQVMSDAKSQVMSNELKPTSARDNRILKGPLGHSYYVHSLAPKHSSMLCSLTPFPGSLTPLTLPWDS